MRLYQMPNNRSNVTHLADVKGDNRLISPEGAIQCALDAIHDGIVTPDKAMVITLDTNAGNGYQWEWFASNLKRSEMIALLTVITNKLASEINDIDDD